ncbi:MAG TPA: hypothetical protein VGD42_14715 [Lysobacter sp.]
MNSIARATVAALIALLLAGCHAAMSTGSDHRSASDEGFDNSSARWPLEFRAHYFGVATYSTYGCQVVYDNELVKVDPEDELEISSASIGDKYPDNLTAGRGPYRNFPPPAVVNWRSSDGTPHEAEVDIGEIFKDQRVRHNASREDVDEHGNDTAPKVILEVNDRTIKVYMRAMIGLKRPRFPDRPHSDFRYDLITVYSRTY